MTTPGFDITGRDDMPALRVTDNDYGNVIVTVDGRAVRVWNYGGPGELSREAAMLRAQYYREGYGDALDARPGREISMAGAR